MFGARKAPREKEWIQESQDILQALKDRIVTTQNQQKMYADRGRIERQFEVEDLVYLHIQPYRQSTLKEKGDEKLKPYLHGPYRMIHCVGAVAYDLELPIGSKIQFFFHVSCLKKAIGKHVVDTMDLPPIDDEGHMVLHPKSILDTQERHLRTR